jgi:hypothetical protein
MAERARGTGTGLTESNLRGMAVQVVSDLESAIGPLGSWFRSTPSLDLRNATTFTGGSTRARVLTRSRSWGEKFGFEVSRIRELLMASSSSLL